MRDPTPSPPLRPHVERGAWSRRVLLLALVGVVGVGWWLWGHGPGVTTSRWLAFLAASFAVLWVGYLLERRRRDREVERQVYGEVQPREPWRRLVRGLALGLLWTAAWFFADEILAVIAYWIAGVLEGLGRPVVEERILDLLQLLVPVGLLLWAWWVGAQEIRRSRRIERELVYGGDE